MIALLLGGLAEFFAWIAFIYFLASDTAGRAVFEITDWATAVVAKYGD